MSKRGRAPALQTFYHKYLTDQDTARFSGRVAQRYTIGTLERLSTADDRMVRRAAVLAIGLSGDYGANATLGRALHDEDRGVRILAESGIRKLWCRVGTAQQRKLLSSLVELNTSGRHDDAIRRATRLIEQAPWIAEGWNQRALALFGTGRYAESIHDCT